VADSPAPVLVIACGNPQRGDDGVAWRVLDALEAPHARTEGPALRLMRVHQLVPELAEPVSGARAVIFVDARAEAAPGSVSCDAVTPGAGTSPLTHALTPPAVLLYADRLFGQAPRAAVVTIGGAAFDHGDELSPEALQAVPKAARRIRSLARLWARRPVPEPTGA
jgi:hydrogenase maturation protease